MKAYLTGCGWYADVLGITAADIEAAVELCMPEIEQSGAEVFIGCVSFGWNGRTENAFVYYQPPRFYFYWGPEKACDVMFLHWTKDGPPQHIIDIIDKLDAEAN